MLRIAFLEMLINLTKLDGFSVAFETPPPPFKLEFVGPSQKSSDT